MSAVELLEFGLVGTTIAINIAGVLAPITGAPGPLGGNGPGPIGDAICPGGACPVPMEVIGFGGAALILVSMFLLSGAASLVLLGLGAVLSILSIVVYLGG